MSSIPLRVRDSHSPLRILHALRTQLYSTRRTNLLLPIRLANPVVRRVSPSRSSRRSPLLGLSMRLSLVSRPPYDSGLAPWVVSLTRLREAGRHRHPRVRKRAAGHRLQAAYHHTISLRIHVPTPPSTKSSVSVLAGTALAASMPGS